MRRVVRSIAIVAVIALVASACTGGDEDPDRRPNAPSERMRRGGHVRFAVLGAPSTLDPYSPSASDLTWTLARPVYPSLYRFGSDGDPRPYLGEVVTSGPDHAVVRLRDMRWSNGRRITTGDVISSWERARPPSGFARIRRMVPTDGNTLRVEGRVSNWETVLASRALVLPAGRARGSVSGGQLGVVDHVPRLKVVYERGPAGDDVAPDRVTAYFVDSVDIMLSLLETGEIDAAQVPSTVNLAERARHLGLELDTVLGSETVVLAGPQAANVGAALDLPALHEAFIRSHGEIVGSDRPEVAPAGPVTLATPSGDELLVLLQEAIQLQLQERGIAVEIIQPDLETFYSQPQRYEARLERRVGSGQGPVLPLFRVDSAMVWRPGAVEGVDAVGTPDGPLAGVEGWWVP